MTKPFQNKLGLYYLFIWALCIADNAFANSKHNIIVLGDSLSAAYGIDERDGWVQLFRNQLDQQGLEITVINASISGETTGGGLSRLPKLLESYQPDQLIIELGGNDGLRGYPIKQMKNNLQKMINMASQYNTEVVLVGMRIPPNYGKRYSELFFNAYHQVSQQMNVTLVPFFLDGVATYPELMQADGIHPTKEAQPKMLENIWLVLKEILN